MGVASIPRYSPQDHLPTPPLLSSALLLAHMHKKGTPRLKGGEGVLNNLICCFEHYNGLIICFITDSYLLLAYLHVGFLYILVQNLIFLILTHNPPKLCRKRVDSGTKKAKVAQIAPPSKIGRGQMIISNLCANIIS